MCPLRLILIFLSATLAGFFVLRNLKSPADDSTSDSDLNPDSDPTTSDSSSTLPPPPPPPVSLSSKVRSVVESVLYSCVDMASGRYLWRHLVSSSKPKRSD